MLFLADSKTVAGDSCIVLLLGLFIVKASVRGIVMFLGSSNRVCSPLHEQR
jgi:hypothetical protein